MDAIIVWIDAHPIITAIIFSLVGGQALMPIMKRVTLLTPSKVDDLLVAALERAVVKKEEIVNFSPEQLERQLSLEAINTIIKIRRARIENSKKNALENKI
jgi:hypothetical protein